MDQDLIKKMMASYEFGFNILQNPQDIAYWPSKNVLAVADDSNGLLIFSTGEEHQLLEHIRQCADAGAVCYNTMEKCLVVSVTKAVSAGDDTPGELYFYNDNFQLIKTLILPQDPKIKYGYVRWVASDPLDGDLWVASGDNEIAALWKYTLKEKKWKIIWKGVGDLEHPSFLSVSDTNSNTLDLIAARWTEQENWTIHKWVIDRKKEEIINQKRLEYKETDIMEPWSAVADAETGYIYSYDYKSGAIQPLPPPKYNKVGDVVGMTKAGQWTSMETHGEYVFVTSSDERCVRVFRKRR